MIHFEVHAGMNTEPVQILKLLDAMKAGCCAEQRGEKLGKEPVLLKVSKCCSKRAGSVSQCCSKVEPVLLRHWTHFAPVEMQAPNQTSARGEPVLAVSRCITQCIAPVIQSYSVSTPLVRNNNFRFNLLVAIGW